MKCERCNDEIPYALYCRSCGFIPAWPREAHNYPLSEGIPSAEGSSDSKGQNATVSEVAAEPHNNTERLKNG